MLDRKRNFADELKAGFKQGSENYLCSFFVTSISLGMAKHDFKFQKFSLRRFVEDQDEEALFQALKDPEVVKHMASSGISRADCDVIVKESNSHWQEHGIGSWAVVNKDEIIGWAGFKIWQGSSFELLVVLGKSSWGLGKEIYSELIKLGRECYDLKSVLVVLPETRKSFQYIVKKAGFAPVGRVEFNGEFFQKFELKFKD